MSREFKKTRTSVDRFLREVNDISFKRFPKYEAAEFSYKGVRYLLTSTGDLYQHTIAEVLQLVHPYMKKYKNEPYLTVTIADNRSFYQKARHSMQLKGLIWAAFGAEDVPPRGKILNKTGNYMACSIDNLKIEVK